MTAAWWGLSGVFARRSLLPAGSRRPVALAALAVLGLAAFLVYASTRPPGPARPDRSGTWDVIVVGSEPEGVAAAVAAAESGARTLLITEDERVGGLFVLGEMNSLDLRTQPFNYHQGLFERWWEGVGRRHSFDVTRAEATFLELLEAARVKVQLGSAPHEPLMDGTRVVGVRSGAENHRARQVIDATSEMAFVAAAGASYTVGWRSLGLDARMADTLVFRIDGVDWGALRRGIRARGPGYAAEDDWVAWGHFGGYPAAYQAEEDGIRLRGLNLGRQEDGSLLVNALLVYGIDPFDPVSLAEGHARAAREAPRIVAYLARELEGFENASLGGVATSLYIRESRHLEAECVVTADDVLDNRVGPLDVAAGGYPLDVQTLTPSDDGYVYGFPEMFGIPLCVSVPIGLENVWVVGKAAGYDPIAASSARVVPVGMTVGEAVGVAAALAANAGLAPRDVAGSEERLRTVRRQLERRGAYLPEVAERAPVGPHEHPHYRAYRLLLSRGLALGGYDNEPRLDDPMAAISYVNMLSNVGQRFHGERTMGSELLKRFRGVDGPLTRERALEITRVAACVLVGRPDVISLELVWDDRAPDEQVPDDQESGEKAPGEQLSDAAALTRGEMYAAAAAVAAIASPTGSAAGVTTGASGADPSRLAACVSGGAAELRPSHFVGAFEPLVEHGP